MLTPKGYRFARPERVAIDMMDIDAPSTQDVFLRMISNKSRPLDFERLEAAARDMNRLPKLLGTLGLHNERLPSGLRDGFKAFMGSAGQ